MIRVSCLMLLDIRVLHEGPGSSFFHDLSIYLSIHLCIWHLSSLSSGGPLPSFGSCHVNFHISPPHNLSSSSSLSLSLSLSLCAEERREHQRETAGEREGVLHAVIWASQMGI